MCRKLRVLFLVQIILNSGLGWVVHVFCFNQTQTLYTMWDQEVLGDKQVGKPFRATNLVWFWDFFLMHFSSVYEVFVK